MVSSSDVQLTEVELNCQLVLGTGKNTKILVTILNYLVLNESFNIAVFNLHYD